MINRPWTPEALDRITALLIEQPPANLTEPCPQWCQEAGKHSWEATPVSGYPCRTHSRDFGMITVSAEETIDSDGRHLSTPVALWFGPEPGRRLHPGDAAALADDVAAAFHLIGSVTP